MRRLFLRALPRWSQADRTSWDKVDLLINRNWPKVAVLHLWPAKRLRVTIQGTSRMRQRARPDLCGGTGETRLPTAIESEFPGSFPASPILPEYVDRTG